MEHSHNRVMYSLLDPAKRTHWDVSDYHWKSGQIVEAYLHQNYDLGMHSHGFVEINLVVSGRGYHYLESDVFPTTPGDLFVIPVKAKHGYRPDGNLDVYHLLLHPHFVDYYATKLHALPGYLPFFTVEPFFRKETNFRHRLVLNEEERSKIVRSLDAVQAEVQSSQAGHETASEALALHAIAQMCRYFSAYNKIAGAGEHAKTKSIQTVFDYVNEQYSRKLTLEDLAAQAHLQPEYFSRLFHRATGVTVMEYVAQVRVRKASGMIIETNKSLGHIAELIGFCDASHMSRTFTRVLGYPPKQLRERIK